MQKQMKKQMQKLREFLFWLSLTAVLCYLNYASLWPATSKPFLTSEHAILGDGTDLTALPFFYDVLKKTWQTHPTHLFYGSVVTEQLNPPGGFALWIPFAERWIALALSPFFPLESLPTAVTFALLLISGLSFAGFARSMGWKTPIIAGLSIAWALNPYTRARAAVHIALTGVFFLPLAFWAMKELVERPKKKILPSLLLLTAVTTAHYYVLMLVFLTPILYLFWCIHRKDTLGPRKLIPSPRLLLTALPAICFLVWNVSFSVPTSLKNPSLVEVPSPQTSLFVLNHYGAHPLDFLTGDLKYGTEDLNPLKALLNEYRYASIDPSETHEHSYGIRWCILALAALVLVLFFKKAQTQSDRHDTVLFWLLASLCLTASLPPQSLVLSSIEWSPSYWFNQIFPHFRVPGRFGIGVHFAALSLSGIALNHLAQRKKLPPHVAWPLLSLLWLFPVLCIIETFPQRTMLMSQVLPSLTELGKRGPCQTGVFLPYLSARSEIDELRGYYHSMQVLRRTDCASINQALDSSLNQSLVVKLGTRAFEAQPETAVKNWEAFLRCQHLSWVYFRPKVSETIREELCRRLQWVRTSPQTCHAPEMQPDFSWKEECLE